jgi:hypothetical protein
MYNVYLGCNQWQTFFHKEEIKRLKPAAKGCKSFWIFDHALKCWHIKIADSYMSARYRKSLESFAAQHDLTLEILHDRKPAAKGIAEYEDEEAFMEQFHKNNQPR